MRIISLSMWRPTNLDNSRTWAYCACSGCGWGLFGHYSHICHFSLPSCLWETLWCGLKYCLKGLLNPKQRTNQIKYQVAGFYFPYILAGTWRGDVITSLMSLQRHLPATIHVYEISEPQAPMFLNLIAAQHRQTGAITSVINQNRISSHLSK